MTNLRRALSSRAGQRNQNWRMSIAIHRDRMLHIRSTAWFRFRSALAHDFELLLFWPLQMGIDETAGKRGHMAIYTKADSQIAPAKSSP
jgi:hypothetical protein